MKGLLGILGILGIGIMSLLVINSVYAMEVTGNSAELAVLSQATPMGTLEGRALYVDADNAAGIIEPPGGDNDGVADFLFGLSRCTASLLAESNIVPVALTAAHCVTDTNGNFNLPAGATLTFETACGDEIIGVQEAWTQIHPGWLGDSSLNDLLNGNDIALIELDKFPDPCTGDNVDRYFIDRNTADDLGLMSEDVGFGRSGVGATGDTLPSGVKRQSGNTYDEGDAFFAVFAIPTTAGSTLVDDFDNGLVANDAMGFIGLTVDAVGKGDDEGLSAGGDSGGPHFNAAKEITGVTSWGLHLTGGPGAGTPDIDGALNSSFGEWSGDVRVATYAAFVDSAIRVLEDNKAEKPMAVGGEFIGIDTTAVLLAGAQMNAAWLIPLIVAAAVIGIVISRKF